MSITSPFDLRALSDLSSDLEATCVVTATSATGDPLGVLDVDSLVLTLDEAWAPHARLEATCSHPDPRMLDPRTAVRINLSLGYRYAGGTLDQHPIASMLLWNWEPTSDGKIAIEAQGDELYLMEWTHLAYSKTYAVGTPIVDVIVDELSVSIGRTPIVEASRAAQLSEPLTIGTGTIVWDIIKTLSDQAGVWTYADPLGLWHVKPRPTSTGQSVVQATTGPGGIVTFEENGMSRDRWANTVILTYGSGQTAYATQTVGPFGTATVGVVAARETTSAPWPGAAAAASAAETILRLKITLGDRRAFTALAAWWLRPGDTLTTPDLDRVLASRVRFSYPDSLMTVTTREA